MIQSGVGGSLCIIQKPRRTLASVWLQRVRSKSRGPAGGRDLTPSLIRPLSRTSTPNALSPPRALRSRTGSLFQDPAQFRKSIYMAKAPWFRTGN